MSEIWVWYLGSSDWDAAHYRALVTEEDRQRAAQFRAANDAGRFLASRALVRAVLGRELEVDPAEVAFDRRCGHCGALDHGQPTVRLGDGRVAPIHFSPTRAGPVVAVAVGSSPVGLDAEASREEVEDLLEGPMFSRRERTWVRRAFPPDVPIRALELWVAKEAIGKAAGLGLEGADQILVPLGGHGWRRGTDAAGGSCWLSAVEIPGTAAAAVATYQEPGSVRVADAVAWNLL